MKTLPLGSSGVSVSSLCLGTMLFATKTDEGTSAALLDQYTEAGGSFLDTANAYAGWVEGGTGGDSESFLGRWMRERGNREKLFLATKVGFGYPGDDRGGAENGLRASQILAECDKSLARLGTDVIDLYYAHFDHRETPLAEVVEAFDKLVEAGKIRFPACSNFLAWRLAEALCISDCQGKSRFVAAQQRHTYLLSNPGHDWNLWPVANDDLMDCCRQRDVRVVAYSPLIRGAYTREDKAIPQGYQWPHTDRRLKVLGDLASEKGCTANQLVLAWMLHSDPAVIPLFSASSAEQMTENLGALDVRLTEEEMQTLNQAGNQA